MLVQLCLVMSGIISQPTLFYEKYELPKILLLKSAAAHHSMYCSVFYYCKSKF